MENPTWGAPRIRDGLLLLGLDISEPTISRYLQSLKRAPQDSKAKQLLTFLNNHREVITAFDFFTVPTLSFRNAVLFLCDGAWAPAHIAFQRDVSSDQRLDCATTPRGVSTSVPFRYVLFDNDAKFAESVLKLLESSDLKPMRISLHSSWQNGVAARWIGNIRRELLDHVIPFEQISFAPLGPRLSGLLSPRPDPR
jgi:hypothetical protein